MLKNRKNISILGTDEGNKIHRTEQTEMGRI
jgi:hypothetical protein